MNELIGKVIDGGIKHPLRILIENRCFAAALVLIYSGMDMMAFSICRKEKQEVTVRFHPLG